MRDKYLKEDEAKALKFELGQTVYSAMGFQLGRYVVAEYVTTTSLEKSELEYVLTRPDGRKEGFSEEDIEKSFFATLDEARVLAIQEWKVTEKKINKQLVEFKDEDFDEILRKTQESLQKKKDQGK